MKTEVEAECCPPVDPAQWDNREVIWENKPFVKDHVVAFLHVPLNFGAVMARCVAKIEAADAKTASRIILSDDNSLWGADVFVEAARDVPGAKMAGLSGIFLSRVFEGPYSRMGEWIKSMNITLSEKGLSAQKLYTYYATCPTCAKKYGKNYVILLAKIR